MSPAAGSGSSGESGSGSGAAGTRSGSGAAESRSGSGAAETLRRLEARLEQASQAAESLFADAAGAAARAIPPAGWQMPRPPGVGDTAESLGEELEPVLRALAALRELIPPDLQVRLREAVRELLLALRALIDWYLERAERQPPAPASPQDIPIL